jgi:predicted enzyme related to lactoylglutathione lyase
MATTFFWYELMTSNLDAAEKFYPAVVGWTTQEFPGQDMRYLVVEANGVGVGGMMTIPPEAAQMGAPPAWVGYVKSGDIGGDTEAVKNAGGQVYRPPTPIPGVGQFSVVADPQGAVYMLLQPEGPDMPPVDPMTPGHVGWREYMGTDYQAAFDFYSSLYGWTKSQAVDMGEMGTYQLYAVDGNDNGGMMNKPPMVPVANWGFYFNVEGIDAAAKRCTDNGGKILMEPMEVPGGQWVVNCMDPQGAYFSMVSNTK